MARLFWDTSALLRRYATREPGAVKVIAVTDPGKGNQQTMTRLLPIEIASVLCLKVRTGELRADQRDEAWELFMTDLALEYELLELTEPVWRLAGELLFRHILRAGDAIHLAAALAIPRRHEFVFWTADRRQANAATAEGLTVELVG